jgi:hypothetical protein
MHHISIFLNFRKIQFLYVVLKVADSRRGMVPCTSIKERGLLSLNPWRLHRSSACLCGWLPSLEKDTCLVVHGILCVEICIMMWESNKPDFRFEVLMTMNITPVEEGVCFSRMLAIAYKTTGHHTQDDGSLNPISPPKIKGSYCVTPKINTTSLIIMMNFTICFKVR